MKTGLLSHLTPVARIAFVVMLILVGLIVAVTGGLVLTMIQYQMSIDKVILLLSDINNPSSIPLLKELQIIQSVLLFIVPSIIAGMLFEKSAAGYFGMKKVPPAAVFLMILVIMMVSLPLVNWMVSVNEMMKLPAGFPGLEKWMKETEEQAALITVRFLDVHSIGGFAVNMLMIAVIPAIGEELLFRGLFQRIFSEWFRNIHVAIFVAALLFSAVHMQFYGFFPRLMLGVMFGYLYFWTGSIWTPVFAHFLNNGAAVVVSYLSNTGVIHADYETFGSTDNVFMIVASVIFTGMLLYGIFFLTKVKRNDEQ